MEIELEKLNLSISDGFCFKDAPHDKLLDDMALLERPFKKDRRKPEGPNGLREPWKDLPDKDLKAKIIAKLDELSDEKLSQLWASLAAPQTHAEAKPLPTEPPGGKLYENRPDKSELPADFILRVYGEWLNGIFTRADLRRLDPKAIMGLQNWEKNHQRKADINLPTKKELNDRLLERPLDALNPHERLAQKRIQAARLNNDRTKTTKW